jgi:hypothetical protein
MKTDMFSPMTEVLACENSGSHVPPRMLRRVAFVEIYRRRSQGTYCLHHQGDSSMNRPDDAVSNHLLKVIGQFLHGATFQKRAILKFLFIYG